MNSFIEYLEQSLSEFDYLFQEGVIFKPYEIDKLNSLLIQFEKIKNDYFFNVGGINPKLKSLNNQNMKGGLME